MFVSPVVRRMIAVVGVGDELGDDACRFVDGLAFNEIGNTGISQFSYC
jgi:hypothetical protein